MEVSFASLPYWTNTPDNAWRFILRGRIGHRPLRSARVYRLVHAGLVEGPEDQDALHQARESGGL
jgi:hypothetical protein